MEKTVIRTHAGVLTVLPDHAALSREAAGLFADLSRERIGSQGRFVAALSGGSTPRLLYRMLGEEPYQHGLDWGRVHLFWADERCVPPGHQDSNYRLVLSGLISRVGLPAQNVHRIRGEQGAETAAREYDDEIRNFFGRDAVPSFDLIVLGAGADGHTASLFPGSAGLQEQRKLALPVTTRSGGPERVTLTLAVLNNAAHVLVLASGSEKAGVVREVHAGGNRDRLPAGLVQPGRGTVRWLVDHDAAALLHTT